MFLFLLVQSEETIFLRICPFLLVYPGYWHRDGHSSLMIFSLVSIVSSFAFLVLLIWALSFS